jgi:hypothetical protein
LNNTVLVHRVERRAATRNGNVAHVNSIIFCKSRWMTETKTRQRRGGVSNRYMEAVMAW